jgi:hypothetical protein
MRARAPFTYRTIRVALSLVLSVSLLPSCFRETNQHLSHMDQNTEHMQQDTRALAEEMKRLADAFEALMKLGTDLVKILIQTTLNTHPAPTPGIGQVAPSGPPPSAPPAFPPVIPSPVPGDIVIEGQP